MSETLDRIPAHLRRHVASQDYEAYDEIDHAVWRFVLLQTYARLAETAHPAYRSGLAQTGISVERIPRIEEMDACLAEYGWGAVCVDGFIPPRAFQEFQALGIMTIAGAIRAPEHLAYTPAPDIIHESAGHAPIIPDPVYRGYLQAFGRIGARAFASPEDGEVHDAIRTLSALREDSAADPAEVERAEQRLAELSARESEPSEAVRLARLHWWTVEYGLVGRRDAYKLYGAGLLSSLGESFFCHAPEVRKLPLSRGCIDVDYDITRPQPQLFVAESFDHLLAVLDEVADGFAQRRGGRAGLEAAWRSREVMTLTLDSGLQLSGLLGRVHPIGDATLLHLVPGWALARNERQLSDAGPGDVPGPLLCALGRLEDGRSPAELRPADLAPLRGRDDRDVLELRFRGGLRVRGRVLHSECDGDGRIQRLTLAELSVLHGDRALGPPRPACALVLGGSVRAAWAGPADPSYWTAHTSRDADPGATVRVPGRHAPGGARASLRALYEEALAVWHAPHDADLVPGLARIAEALRKEHPDAWLLRWNLLECLGKADQGVRLACELRDELLEIEARHPRDLPISMGLRYLGFDPPAHWPSDVPSAWPSRGGTP